MTQEATKGVGPPPEIELTKDFKGGEVRYKVRTDMVLFVTEAEYDQLVDALESKRPEAAEQVLVQHLEDQSAGATVAREHIEAAKSLVRIALRPDYWTLTGASGG